MPMLKDESTILKSVMLKLDNDIAMVVTYQYHTERNESNDVGKSKIDRTKSKYRWMARVFKLSDLVKKINWLREDANRMSKFKWPNDPWPYYISAGYPENWKIADWLSTKLKKIKTWEDGQKHLAGWQSGTKTRIAGYNETAKYQINGYLDEAGNTVSLTDRDTLLKLVGKNLIKVVSK